MKKSSKLAQVNFRFIARNPATIMIAAGVLFLLIGKDSWGLILTVIGIILHVVWLRGGF
jgi:hypothetical protein